MSCQEYHNMGNKACSVYNIQKHKSREKKPKIVSYQEYDSASFTFYGYIYAKSIFYLM